ncbi:probable G-protein coupled receptor 82 [Electrophorus electricus]|uniref:G-protein coupled receptors family 1 profile domain-containing protein n=1 Tax=Electrophorus electricus TaxID=8005 RepID=A0A4W4ETH0_ELEEL|nr:probable G-protein coupled receptor 82 [Electrophorus electricus]
MAFCSQANLSNISSCLCQTTTTHLGLPVLYATVFLSGLPGNALSLWIFVAKIPAKTATHIYLINLGISNLMLCLTMPFLGAYYAMGASWPAPSSMCQLAINGLTPVLHTNIGVGMMSLTWLALSRFATLIQLKHGRRPSRCIKVLPDVILSRLRQTPFALGVCLGTWAIVAMAIIPSVAIYSMKEMNRVEDGSEEVCYSVAVEVGGSGSQAFALAGIVMFFLCLLLVLSAYTAVIRHFYRSRNSTSISDRQKVYSRVFRNIVVIQVVLLVCLLPHHVYKAIFIKMAWTPSPFAEDVLMCHPMSMPVEVKNVFLCLATLRCSTDPIMYFLLDKTFKKHTLRLFRVAPSTQSSQASRTVGECG